jgi:hypothetical protein
MNLVKYSLLMIALLTSCGLKESSQVDSAGFDKSFKKQQNHEFNQHLDSITKIYSNYKYHISFDAPDNWSADAGVSGHTIFRAYQKDSAITFSINVIDMGLKNDKVSSFKDIWEFYQNNKNQFDNTIISYYEKQMNTKVENYVCNRSIIKNKVCLRRIFYYKVYDFDLDYFLQTISYQTIINDCTITFTLTVPKIFYDGNQKYFENLFRNIYFLKNSEEVMGLMNSK